MPNENQKAGADAPTPPTEEILARALLNIRIAASRVGWDRSDRSVAEYAEHAASEALWAAGYDAYSGTLDKRPPTSVQPAAQPPLEVEKP